MFLVFLNIPIEITKKIIAKKIITDKSLGKLRSEYITFSTLHSREIFPLK